MHSHTLSRKECRNRDFFRRSCRKSSNRAPIALTKPRVLPHLAASGSLQTMLFRGSPPMVLQGRTTRNLLLAVILRLPTRTLFVRDFFLGHRRISLIFVAPASCRLFICLTSRRCHSEP